MADIYYETPLLETERLILKRGTLEDYEKVYEYDFRKLRDIAGEFEFVKQNPSNIASFAVPTKETYDWIIYLKDGTPIGNVVADSEEKDIKAIELAFNTHPSYWRKGYTYEAVVANPAVAALAAVVAVSALPVILAVNKLSVLK